MIHRRRAAAGAALVALAGTVAASGCGESTSTAGSQARGSLDTFLGACAHQRPLDALATLQTPAQALVVGAGSALRGCGRVLGVPDRTVLTPADFRAADARRQAFDGASGRFVVAIAGTSRSVTLTFGGGGWRLEGPGG